ncbi:PTS sugar transporter subunit IIA [Candidimonas sp. SYP-B2681]|uniref:PTS sugar transporter subunit IIA n=1 Tax=Candidimonas sp. SYP-B2681 TaxID=2497686 RepID=UPI000F890FE4|nr:PTS sugar transporter subunit IIA [Candidimonas sp. SYP-B2681]RTZ39301.1 PTS sugar transporter subunit IIA [Candidimonas sp. SYP-B2681]
MAHIVLVMHQPLGSAFAACAEHILGQKVELTVFDIAPDAEPKKLISELAQQLAHDVDEAALILCDIFGATPFNIAKQALKLATEQGVTAHLITGTNLCMVLKALTDQQENPDRLSESVRLGALRGIVNADQTG